MIEVRDLRKRYGDFEAVRGVSFTAEPGRIVGILGPNGAGKTTILKALAGCHGPTSGTVSVEGFDAAEDPFEVKRRVGYLPETVSLYADMTAREHLAFLAEVRGVPRAERRAALENSAARCGISDLLSVPVEHLSKGYRQRVGLAQTILGDPPVLILDEPTSGLDPNQIREIRTLIRALAVRKTVILSTHILQEAEALCSDVLILNEGEIAATGTPDRIAESLKGEERLDLTIKAASPESILRAAPRLTIGALSGEPERISDGVFRTRIRAPSGCRRGSRFGLGLGRGIQDSGIAEGTDVHGGCLLASHL